MGIPGALLRQLYTFGSLRNIQGGIRFALQNRYSDAVLTRLRAVKLDGDELAPETIRLQVGGGAPRAATDISARAPFPVPMEGRLEIRADGGPLASGPHRLEIVLETVPFGEVSVVVEDAVPDPLARRPDLPREEADDYSDDIIRRRQAFVEGYTGQRLRHINHYSFDPVEVRGNCENLTGVAQVPLGFAGPIHIRGEAAQGDFLVPLATTEGTLVASYNRGIQLLNLCGGARCTVLADGMQRAPVFDFEDARAALVFVRWVREHEAAIRAQAEATSRVAKLQDIEPYLVSRYAYLRFSYTTGDAAGQNMVSKATDAACKWILGNAPGITGFCLDSNLASDKKSSYVNTLRGRGKRVTAEVVVPRELLVQRLHTEPEVLVHQYQVTNLSSIVAGVNNNGLHTANALAAIFIATGQDVANVAESCAGVLDVQLTGEGNLYASITLPSLIVATHGGGTGLATQRECLELMGCSGPGTARKFAEIVAGVVLAGELSLGAAIMANEWVSSHERLGRNR
jgi:hydroxymethylglutaryl-CoA reductase (NADPH)